ncbi:MAG TPA: thiamine-phosphate kinase [Phycisphaerales bacterium]|nr:thiamine-phosphate kinase [Phycisphaerales bacterium]
MRESDLLERIFRRALTAGAGAGGRVEVGPGDDCAVLAPGAPAERLLVTVDQLVEGRHVLPGDATPVRLVARKALARSLSDIAAMGGTPRWALAAAALPERYPHAAELFDALHDWGTHWECPLIGGDISALPAGAPLTLSVTVGGTAHPSRGPVLRSGARPGDGVYVTGTLGGSFGAGGLGKHLRFEPRLVEAAWLCDHFGSDLHAMLDTSDGLGRDAARVARASRVRMVLDPARFPLSEHASGWRAAASDGEDYELLLTVTGTRDVPAACPATGTPLTRIGAVEMGSGCVLRAPGGGPDVDAGEMGWDPALGGAGDTAP